MQELFRAAVANEKLNVKLEALKAEKVSAMILLSEESRRMMEMMELTPTTKNLRQCLPI